MVDTKPYILAGGVSLVIFIMGFLLGFSMLNMQLEDLRSEMDKNELEIRNVQMEILFLNTFQNETFCDYLKARLEQVDKNAWELGTKLINPKGFVEEYFDIIKRRYSLSLIQSWLFSQYMKERCDTERIDVLYFFSKDCDDCASQGYVLDYLVNSDETKSIHVFALDKDLDEPIIQMLVRSFNITITPEIVINDVKYSGFQTRETLIDIFCSLNSNLTYCS